MNDMTTDDKKQPSTLAGYFTKQEATDLLGKSVNANEILKDGPHTLVEKGAKGEVTSAELAAPASYEVGVAWGDPDKRRIGVSYDKTTFEQGVTLSRDDIADFDRPKTDYEKSAWDQQREFDPNHEKDR